MLFDHVPQFRLRNIGEIMRLTGFLKFIYLFFAFFQGAGLGRLKPNVLLMGFKSDWRSDSPCAAHSYIGILQ